MVLVVIFFMHFLKLHWLLRNPLFLRFSNTVNFCFANRYDFIRSGIQSTSHTNFYRVSHKKVYFKNFCNAKTCKDKEMKVSPCINNVLEICLPSKSSLSILLS